MTRYPTEIKQQVYEKFLWGHTAKELTEEFSVPLSTVYVWCGNWKRGLAVKALADIPLEDMGKPLLHMKEQKQQLDAVEQELSIIHESGVIRTIPTAKRIDIALSYWRTAFVQKGCLSGMFYISGCVHPARKASRTAVPQRSGTTVYRIRLQRTVMQEQCHAVLLNSGCSL